MNIHYTQNRATTKAITEQIDSINKTFKKLGIKTEIEEEAYGSPLDWTIYQNIEHQGVKSKVKLLSNANNKEVYLYLLGINLGLNPI